MSKSLKKIFEGMIDDDKIFVVENCIDDQYLLTDQEIEEKLAALENKKVLHVLWLSNFIRSKAIRLFWKWRKQKKNVWTQGERNGSILTLQESFLKTAKKNTLKVM